MKELRISLIALALVAFFSVALTAQCDTWNNSPQKDEAENAHVLYRGVVKGKTEADLAALSAEEFNLAYDNWKTAYGIAPAADGQRATHYIDGRKILKAIYSKETDADKKKELADKIMGLYDGNPTDQHQ